MRRKRTQGKKDSKPAQERITISVTRLCWAVSKVMNFVNTTKKSVVVTNRNIAIALIVPVDKQDINLNLDKTRQFELEVNK